MKTPMEFAAQIVNKPETIICKLVCERDQASRSATFEEASRYLMREAERCSDKEWAKAAHSFAASLLSFASSKPEPEKQFSNCWEYCAEPLYNTFVSDRTNELGKQGWELVSVTEDRRHSLQNIAYFKRRVA